MKKSLTLSIFAGILLTGCCQQGAMRLDSGATFSWWTSCPVIYESNDSTTVKGLGIYGNVNYSISNATLNLKVGTIQNNRNGGTSGTLRLNLWATKEHYNGGQISGHIISTQTLGQLQGSGYHWSNQSYQTRYTKPPTGTYYTTLTLEEYDNSGKWTIYDFVTFDEERNL